MECSINQFINNAWFLRTFWILGAVGVLVLASVGEGAPKGKCHVIVKYEYKSGRIDKKNYDIPAKSPSDCQKKSELYKANGAPKIISKKVVAMKWGQK